MHIGISEIISIAIIIISIILSIKNVCVEQSNEDIVESIMSVSATVLTFFTYDN